MDRIRFGHYLPHWLYVSVEELFKSSMSHHKCISYPVYCLLFYLIFLQTQVFFFSAMYSSSLCLHSRLLVRRMSPIWPACVVGHLINDSGWSLLLCPFISNALTQHTRAHAGFCNWWHDSVHLQAKRALLFLSLFFFFFLNVPTFCLLLFLSTRAFSLGDCHHDMQARVALWHAHKAV